MLTFKLAVCTNSSIEFPCMLACFNESKPTISHFPIEI